MRLAVISRNGTTSGAVVAGDSFACVPALENADLLGAISDPGLLAQAAREAALLAADAWTPLAGAEFGLPVARPGKIVCLGLNYADHAREGGHAVPDYPSFFLRVATSLVAAGAPILRPRVSVALDYEAEMLAIIGRRCRNVSEADALDHVFGYSCFNDASLRDYQRKTTQWTPGKNFDRTGAVGPVVVTADELPPGASGLDISCRLNGALVQNANTRDMIVSTARAIALISEFTTLEPGDLVALGTPDGVGHARRPPLWMKHGDAVEISIERIGTLRNTVADEA